MQFYRPEYFKPHELVPPEVWEKYKHKGDDFIWMFFRPELLFSLDWIRKIHGPRTCNNYIWGGQREESGLRLHTATGASMSQHKLGAASDSVGSTPAEEIRQAIIDNPWFVGYQYITCLEVGPDINWLHFDVRNWDKKAHGILLVER